jgi:hypothetical protein
MPEFYCPVILTPDEALILSAGMIALAEMRPSPAELRTILSVLYKAQAALRQEEGEPC